VTLSPERHGARMSKITNDGLTWSGTGCFMASVGVKGLKIKTTQKLNTTQKKQTMQNTAKQN